MIIIFLSYKELLLAHKEFDLAVQAMHELGNIYHYNKDVSGAYRLWNDALDTLMGFKNSLIQWRKQFVDQETNALNTVLILEKLGVWGCVLGGLLTSKMAQ